MKMGQAKVEIVKLTNLSLRRRQEEAVFFYILQGEAQYQVCFEEHRMHVDDFTLVNPTEFYTLSAEKTTECILAVISIPVEWIQKRYAYFGYAPVVCDIFQSEGVRYVDEQYVEELRLNLKECMRQYFTSGEFTQKLLENLFSLLHEKFLLADYMGVERDAWALGKMDVFNEIYKQMIENHSRKDCMQYIIGNMYYTPEYVNRIYRAFTGSSFQEGVNNVRCWASEADLIMTNDTILDIAERHGFSDNKYYYKYFKRWYGMTPKAYRQRCRENLKVSDQFIICDRKEACELLRTFGILEEKRVSEMAQMATGYMRVATPEDTELAIQRLLQIRSMEKVCFLCEVSKHAVQQDAEAEEIVVWRAWENWYQALKASWRETWKEEGDAMPLKRKKIHVVFLVSSGSSMECGRKILRKALAEQEEDFSLEFGNLIE